MSQSSRDTTEAEAREWLLGIWPEVNSWTGLFASAWLPAPGSDLAEDDAAVSKDWEWLPSQTARMSLAIGTDHLVTAVSWLINFPPRPFAVTTLARTAMIGGAQAIWMLSGPDRDERVRRTRRVERESTLNHKMWADGLEEPHPDTIEPERLDEIRQALADIAAGQEGGGVKTTQVIKAAAEHLYPSDPQMVREMVGLWRMASATAHALPWEQLTRPSTVSGQRGGHHVTETTASLVEHLGSVSLAYAFVRRGLRLIGERGGRPLSEPL